MKVMTRTSIQVLLLLGTLSMVLHAQDYQYQIPITTNDVSSIDRINQQVRISSFLTEYQKILELSKEVVWFDAGLSLLAYVPDPRTLPPSYSNSPGYSTFGVSSCLQFKINLFHPKLPQSGYTLARIKKFESMAYYYGISIPEGRRSELELFKNKLANYDKTKWMRPSIAIALPFSTNANYSGNTLSGIVQLDRTTLCLGYDIYDYATIQAGINLKGEFNFGIYLDLTTPAYLVLNAFANIFRSASPLRFPSLPDKL